MLFVIKLNDSKKAMIRKSPAPRRFARRLALQALYQWQLTALPVHEIEAQFVANTHTTFDKVDMPYFLELLRSIPPQIEILDAQMQPILDRPLQDLNVVELTILRIGSYELAHRLEIPYRVVIDEALRLAKTFGTVEGFKYVNAILDKLAKKLRKIEIEARTQKGEG
jgi:N utilization substance protein B